VKDKAIIAVAYVMLWKFLGKCITQTSVNATVNVRPSQAKHAYSVFIHDAGAALYRVEENVKRL